MTRGVIGRLLGLAAVCLALNAWLTSVATAAAPPVRQPLATLPWAIGGWEGSPAPAFDTRTLDLLGVDDYVSRIYQGDGAVGLYVGYYASQQQGDVIHSPMNCLPGSGWVPAATGVTSIALGDGRRIEVKRVVVEKGEDRQLVLYWYQSQGRVIADEYTSKALLVWNAIRSGRTDAALVRVVAPIHRHDFTAAAAERRAIAFVQSLFPLLGTHVPA